MMKRILELFGEPIAIGGQETYVVNQVQHMDLSGMQIDCLTPYSCESDIQRERICSWGGKVYELGLPFRPGKSREYVSDHLSSFLSKNRYDIVHIHSGSTSMLAIAADRVKRDSSAFAIVHSHNAADRMTLRKKAIRRLCAPRMMRADMLCACSREAAESKFIPPAQKKVRILRNGIDAKKFYSALDRRELTRAKYLENESTFVLTHVGRLAPEKNHQFIVDVFSKLISLKHDAVLWLVGDGQERSAIETKIYGMGLENKVKMFGSRDDIDELMAASDAFIFPSRFEGLPFSLLEAQASGLHCYTNEDVVHGCGVDLGLMHMLSLNDGAESWAREIASLVEERRRGNPALFQEAGFDVLQSARELEQIYKHSGWVRE